MSCLNQGAFEPCNWWRKPTRYPLPYENCKFQLLVNKIIQLQHACRASARRQAPTPAGTNQERYRAAIREFCRGVARGVYCSTRPERRRPQGSREQARTLREQKNSRHRATRFCTAICGYFAFCKERYEGVCKHTRPNERRQQGARSPIVQSKTHSQIYLYHRRWSP